MRREDEYRQLADSVRRSGGEEENALIRAQWEILAATYVQLADQSATMINDARQSKKIDDAGTYTTRTFRW